MDVFFSLARSPHLGSRPRLKMAMHALAEGYLIKGDFGQAQRGEKDDFPILSIFFWLKTMDASNKPELF